MGIPAPAGPGEIDIECARVPTRRGERTLRVPCLGGVTPTLLLTWWLELGTAPLILVNRGWCENCPAAGAGFAAEHLLAEARTWLQDCAVPSEQWPRLRLAADGLKPVAPAIAPPAPCLSRRGFFRRATVEVGQAPRVAAVPAGPRAQLKAQVCPLPAREAWLAVLRRVAQRGRGAIPVRAWPALTLAPRCQDHGLCANNCPTGALARQAQDGASVLSFDAARCVACAACEKSCPEQALSFTTDGTPERVVLRRTPLRECLLCGSEFRATSLSNFCMKCSSDRSLARSMFGTGVASK